MIRVLFSEKKTTAKGKEWDCLIEFAFSHQVITKMPECINRLFTFHTVCLVYNEIRIQLARTLTGDFSSQGELIISGCREEEKEEEEEEEEEEREATREEEKGEKKATRRGKGKSTSKHEGKQTPGVEAFLHAWPAFVSFSLLCFFTSHVIAFQSWKETEERKLQSRDRPLDFEYIRTHGVSISHQASQLCTYAQLNCNILSGKRGREKREEEEKRAEKSH